MLVDDIEMPSTDETYEYIDSESAKDVVFVQYPDGALWSVVDKVWRKENNA